MAKVKDKINPNEWVLLSEIQKFDYLMELYLYGDDVDTKALNHYGNKMTINQAKSHMERRIIEMINGTSKKCKCPTCYKPQGFQHHSLNDGIMEFLWVLVNLSLEDVERIDLNAFGVDLDYMIDNEFMPSFHYNDNNVNGDGRSGVISLIYNKTCDSNGANGRKPTGYATLKYWGFMKKDDKHRNPLVLGRGKTNGFWLPLRNAFDFILNDKAFPSECWTLNDEVVKWGTKMVTFSECELVEYKERQKFRTTYF